MVRPAVSFALAAAGVIGLLAPQQARAQESLRPVLLSLISDAQKGVCGRQLAPLVAVSCQQQIGGLSKRLQSMGVPVSATFQGVDKGDSVFQVRFQGGGAMTWLIAQNPAGQVTTFWTP
jgi:hypothetical protein